MLRDWGLALSIGAFAVAMLGSSTATATPTTFAITSGNIVLSVADSVTGTNVLQSVDDPVTNTLELPIDGDFLVFDPTVGTSGFGTITDLEITMIAPLVLDLDESIVDLDTAIITDAALSRIAGGELTSSGAFSIDTVLSGVLSGTLGSGAPLAPGPVPSGPSAASGTFFDLGGGLLEIGVLGVNIAELDTLAGGTVVVTADFVFLAQAIPEPGTALLVGFGLAGLSARGRRRTS